jgi:hypothetical protein
MVTAAPNSAAPPISASSTTPINAWDIPRAVPVSSAAPTRTSLKKAAPTEAATRMPAALPTLQISP